MWNIQNISKNNEGEKYMASYIKIKGLVKRFKENTVLQNISLECEKGKIYGITGYNGCGKTVFFKCLCGLEKEDAGEIMIHEQRKKPGELLKSVGIIIEEPAFLENKSGMKNLRFLYEIRNKKNIPYLSSIMEKVGLDSQSKKHVGKFSLGMRQRLAIAQAIMENPDILILDEPMNGLDKSGVQEMRKLFLNMKEQGKVILMASHNREDIEMLCDEVYEMEKGELKRILK